MKGPKMETLKLLFVYGNVTFIVIAGFYVLFQLATRQELSEAAGAIGAASIFAGFVGMAIQFLTGAEIATRADKAATAAFTTGLSVPPPTTTTVTEGPPATTTVTTGTPEEPEGGKG